MTTVSHGVPAQELAIAASRGPARGLAGPEQYEEIRADSRRFLNVPGHQAAAQGAAVVVAERDGYVIVEKIGHAGDVVEALDERNAGEGLEQMAASEEWIGAPTMEERERRLGLNEAVFREANERIQDLNQTFATFTDELVLVCECGDGKCAEKISMTPAAYEELRAESAHFAIVPGHEIPDVEQVIAQREGYYVVRKDEEVTRQIAEVTDPR